MFGKPVNDDFLTHQPGQESIRDSFREQQLERLTQNCRHPLDGRDRTTNLYWDIFKYISETTPGSENFRIPMDCWAPCAKTGRISKFARHCSGYGDIHEKLRV